ncbi:hypothetical protein F3Y22_tig00110474pilonHSYRG00125 [Hibiscus syriacus]|uniref:Uncharacterized protein n=1 Tax=Hibiscus syriacus TaxID=106335 RepID=A0A6A3AEX0_HIBSY|nr:hypothetical protein F3Y22_tig00110474pilonHSYRG00125 [Hibiscus syriacus]
MGDPSTALTQLVITSNTHDARFCTETLNKYMAQVACLVGVHVGRHGGKRSIRHSCKGDELRKCAQKLDPVHVAAIPYLAPWRP